MGTIKVAWVLLRAMLEDLPGDKLPIMAAAALCSLTALLISLPSVLLMKATPWMIVPGMMMIGLAAQAAIIVPSLLLPQRCGGGLESALAGILSIIILGLTLPNLLPFQVN
ncbi:MAG: hypothetical protein WED11_07485 [Natronospirillum sp.]